MRQSIARAFAIAYAMTWTVPVMGNQLTPGDLYVSGWGYASEGLWRFQPDVPSLTKLPTLFNSPDNPDMAIGADGTIWRTDGYGLLGFDAVTGNRLHTYSGLYKSVAIAPDGSLYLSGGNSAAYEGLWKFEPGSASFSRISSSGATDDPDLAVTSDGMVWQVGYGNLQGRDPVTGAIVRTFAGLYQSVAVAPNGHLILHGSGPNFEGLWDFDPVSNTAAHLNTVGTDHSDLAIGLDGTIWMASGDLKGFDPVTGALTYSVAGNYRALAVVAPVPIPPAAWLFGSALGVMGWMRRKVYRTDTTGGSPCSDQ